MIHAARNMRILARYDRTKYNRNYIWRRTATWSMATWKLYFDPMCIWSWCYYGSGSFSYNFIAYDSFLQITSSSKLNYIRRLWLWTYKSGSKPISNFLNYFGRPMVDFCNYLSFTAASISLIKLLCFELLYYKDFIFSILRILRGREEIKAIISLLNKCKII